MNKQDLKVLIAVGLICVLIGMLLGVGISMIPEGKCIRNPLYYGISAYGDFNCNCYNNKGWEWDGFIFNKTGVFPIK